MQQVTVIVPAAGSGSRMGGIAKQFRMLGDAPVLAQTLRAFARLDEITSLIAAVSEGDVDQAERMLGEYGLEATVIVGGATRQASVAKGIKSIGDSTEIVLVHDAVRPFVSRSQILEVIAAIREYGAAAVAVPVVDTLRRGVGDTFGVPVDRRNLFRMLTPQGARIDLLLDGYGQAAAESFVGTDDVEILQRAGVNVRLVRGDERNIKLTRPADWALAEALWPDWQAQYC